MSLPKKNLWVTADASLFIVLTPLLSPNQPCQITEGGARTSREFQQQIAQHDRRQTGYEFFHKTFAFYRYTQLVPSTLSEAADTKLLVRLLTASGGISCVSLPRWWVWHCTSSADDFVVACVASSRLRNSLSSYFNRSFSCSFCTTTSYT